MEIYLFVTALAVLLSALCLVSLSARRLVHCKPPGKNVHCKEKQSTVCFKFISIS